MINTNRLRFDNFDPISARGGLTTDYKALYSKYGIECRYQGYDAPLGLYRDITQNLKES